MILEVLLEGHRCVASNGQVGPGVGPRSCKHVSFLVTESALDLFVIPMAGGEVGFELSLPSATVTEVSVSDMLREVRLRGF